MPTPTETLTLFDKKTDTVRTLKYRVLKNPPSPRLKVEVVPRHIDGLDPNDSVRAPVIRILMDREHELNPRETCVRGDRADCTLYDRLVRVSRAFLTNTPKGEQARVLTSPESALLQGEPVFCRVCVLEEHQRRKRENRFWRRCGRWLRQLR